MEGYFYLLDITIDIFYIEESYSKVNIIKYNYGVNFKIYFLEEIDKNYNINNE